MCSAHAGKRTIVYVTLKEVQKIINFHHLTLDYFITPMSLFPCFAWSY